MKKTLLRMVLAVVAAFLVIGITACGNAKEQKAKELAERSAAVTEKMQKEIQADPTKAAEIQAKYQKELDDIAKESAALAK